MDDPYTILPQDNPSFQLVSHPLDHSNYRSWSKAMTMALLGKNKFGFVDGSIPKPAADSPNFVAWQRNNNIVASWLLNSLSKEMQIRVLHCSNAANIWEDLRQRFERKNGPRIFQLKRELLTLVLQQGSLSVSAYYTKLKSLWESLIGMRPAHLCTCGGIQPWVDHLQTEYVMRFLMGLNDSFSSIRGQIVSADSVPPMTKVFSLIIQDETQKEVGTASAPSADTHTFVVRKVDDNKNKGFKKDRPTHAHCGIAGHSKDKCYKLHGYPSNYKKLKSPQTDVVNQVSNGPDSSHFQFTAQQYSQLMNLLQSQVASLCIHSCT